VNPVVLQIASGNAFFIGMTLTVIAFVLRLWLSHRIAVVLLMAGWLAGLSLVIVSANPMSWWLYGFWLAFAAGVRVLFIRGTAASRAAATIAFASLSLSLCLIELPYRLAQPVTVFTNQPVYVVGDSLSAGIQPGERVWPAVLSDLTHLRVINLARPGATLETARDQANRIDTANAVVILEIGGNDILGRATPGEFYRQLDRLLARLKQGNHRLVMFELPLLPFWNAYGRYQRVLAEKYRVTLIPKGRLAAVLGSPGGTRDGLHLSQKGHNRLARTVARLLRIEKPVQVSRGAPFTVAARSAPTAPEGSGLPKESMPDHPHGQARRAGKAGGEDQKNDHHQVFPLIARQVREQQLAGSFDDIISHSRFRV